jgi:SRSO17 transposase
MLARALAAGVPAAWVTADEVYGGNPSLCAWLEARALPYVLAIRCTEVLQVPDGPPTPAKLLAAGVPPERWLTINAGDGAKGKRWYAWTQVELTADGAPAGWARRLLIRRNLRTGALALYRCAGPATLPLAALAWVAGCRWAWRKPSRPPRGCAAWMSTRSAAGAPGTGG